MAVSARSMSVLLLVAGAIVSSAHGQDAGDRCTGTLCDFYYGGAPAEAPKTAQPAAPTVLSVPSGGYLGRLFGGAANAPAAAPGQTAAAAPAAPARPLIGVGGGGLAAMARGAPAERCTGTLCDLYYGGPPPEAPEPAAAPATAATSTEDAPPPRRSRGRRSAARQEAESEAPVERRAPAYCAATAGDPWQCYRR